MMKKRGLSVVTLYDTACGSDNLGDAIIMDAVTKELNLLFPGHLKVNFPTHYPLARFSKKLAWANEFAFVGGTNLLRNHWKFSARKNQWSLSFIDAFRMTPAILMGTGWNRYSGKVEFKAKAFYKNALSSHWNHAVRDSYTVQKLRQCRIENVINTGCPTLWSLTPEKLAASPRHVSEDAVFTLTDYSVDRKRDLELIAVLSNEYRTLYFWPQGARDLYYFNTLVGSKPELRKKVEILPINLSVFDSLLQHNDIDYIGTRLHAGIRAIQHNRKTIVIAVDNRATEMKKDYNLPVIDREEVPNLARLMRQTFNQDIQIGFDCIRAWKEQFTSHSL